MSKKKGEPYGIIPMKQFRNNVQKPYSVNEAFIDFKVDIETHILRSLNRYALKWGWSRAKVQRERAKFIDDIRGFKLSWGEPLPDTLTAPKKRGKTGISDTVADTKKSDTASDTASDTVATPILCGLNEIADTASDTASDTQGENTLSKHSIVSNTLSSVIYHLNMKSGKRFKPSSTGTEKLITARVNDGYSVDDFKKVIDTKCGQWLGGDMEKYLQPSTLFGSKFENYLNETSNYTAKDGGWRM
ncbi:MAG: conserved phage C-terminal domain-containing protein [Sulfurimonadaceae bacterium]